MKKLLTSTWFALGLGAILFVVTMLYFPTSSPKSTTPADTNVVHAASTNGTEKAETAEKPAESHDTHAEPVPTVTPLVMTPLSGDVGEPGSRAFNDPYVNKLIDELKREKVALMSKEKELRDLERQISLQKAEFGSMTQEVLQFKLALERTLTNQLTLIYRTETNKLQELANIYTNMPPQNAVEIMNKMTVDEIAKIMQFMPERNKALILENFATNDLTRQRSLATEISQRMRKVSAEIDVPQFKK